MNHQGEQYFAPKPPTIFDDRQALEKTRETWINYLDLIINRNADSSEHRHRMERASEIAKYSPLIHVAPLQLIPKFLMNSAILPSSEGEAIAGIRSNTFDFDKELGLDQFVFADINRFHWNLDMRVAFFINPQVLQKEDTYVSMRDIANFRLVGHPPDEQKRVYLQETFTGKVFQDEIFPRLLLARYHNPDRYLDRERPFELASPYPENTLFPYDVSPEAKLPTVNIQDVMGVYTSPFIGFIDEKKKPQYRECIANLMSTLSSIHHKDHEDLSFFEEEYRRQNVEKMKFLLE